MKIQLLPSSFESDGAASQRQHLSCIIVDDTVAFDAGSLALACSDDQRKTIRDVVISHVHLDHIAGLPFFIDDLYSTLSEPIRVHSTAEMITALERDIFNWTIYPRFSELSNSNGPVLEYKAFEAGREFRAAHLKIMPIAVNHGVQSFGFVVSDGDKSLGITGDTAHTGEIWTQFSRIDNLSAVLVECAFPDDLGELAEKSHHMTPVLLGRELRQFTKIGVPIYVVNIKPVFREQVVDQIGKLGIAALSVLQVGKVYEF